MGAAFAAAVGTDARLADRDVDVIHVVGGGSLNELLCQATADRSGLPVLAGPVEATALGNVLIQARAHGWFGSDAPLETLRAAVARSEEHTSELQSHLRPSYAVFSLTKKKADYIQYHLSAPLLPP